MRYWLDTEFMEDGRTIVLLSLGAVCEDGREFYAENSDAEWADGNEWVKQNVIPQLTGPTGDEWLPRNAIADLFHLWVLAGGGTPEFWGYYCDYDWVAVCQMYGRMVDLPQGWPMYMLDVKQLAMSVGNPKLTPPVDEHHALADARWTKFAWEFLMQRPVAVQ